MINNITYRKSNASEREVFVLKAVALSMLIALICLQFIV